MSEKKLFFWHINEIDCSQSSEMKLIKFLFSFYSDNYPERKILCKQNSPRPDCSYCKFTPKEMAA